MSESYMPCDLTPKTGQGTFGTGQIGAHSSRRPHQGRDLPHRRKTVDTTELRRLAEAEAEAERAVIEEVARLTSEEGATWREIGDALGVRRQGAHRKYATYQWDPTTARAYVSGEISAPPSG